MKRVGRAVVELAGVLFGVLLITFAFLHWLPGDPAELYAGEEATLEEVQRVRERMGLDQPIPVQLYRYAARLVVADLGRSLRSGRPVLEEILSRMSVTLRLTLIATAVSIVVALPSGALAASRPHGWIARLLDWGGLFVLAVPVYWLGLVLILVFAVTWRWLPPGGSESWSHLILPALTLGVHTGAATGRILRASLLDVLGQSYLITAQGKGAPHSRTLWVHALPNALIPVVTFFGMESGRLLGGAVLTETVFAVNGLGRFLVTSIAFRDYPAVLGVVLFMAGGVTLANLAADIVCTLLDPRTRSENE